MHRDTARTQRPGDACCPLPHPLHTLVRGLLCNCLCYHAPNKCQKPILEEEMLLMVVGDVGT